MRNTCIMKPAIFIDRDGVLIDESEYPIVQPEQVRLLPGVAQAVRRLNDAAWPVIVITNQAIIARGMATEEQVAQVHRRMADLLQEESGARIDGLYLCPHHPNPEQPGRVESLSIDCDCRKPRPGLLLLAARELEIDLQESYFIGDSQSDVVAGHRAGVNTILLTESGKGGADGEASVGPDYCARTLSDAVRIVLSMKHG